MIDMVQEWLRWAKAEDIRNEGWADGKELIIEKKAEYLTAGKDNINIPI